MNKSLLLSATFDGNLTKLKIELEALNTKVSYKLIMYDEKLSKDV